MKKKVAVVGLGDYTTKYHIPAIQASEKMELIGVESKDPADVKEWSGKLGVPGFSSIDKLLDTTKPDFVVIAVYHNQYLPLVREAAKRGIHVFKEKPLATSIAEGNELERIVLEHNIHMMFGTQRRFSPAFEKFAEFVGKLKGLYYFEARGGLGVRNPGEGWRGNKEIAGGGVMLDWGYHLTDVLLWNFGMPKGVVGKLSYNARPDISYDTEDLASVIFDYGDFFGTVSISRALPKSEYYRVVGVEQIVEYDNGEVRLLDIDGKIIETQTFDTPKIEFVKSELEYFCAVLDGKETLKEDAEYHLQHMAIIEAIYTSQEEGRVVNPDEILR